MALDMTLLGWVGAVLGFGFLVLFHEFGHFMALKALRSPVHAFSIGFGSPLLKRTWWNTEFRLGWLPLGGYVMPEDPDELEKREAAGEPLFPDYPPLSQFFIAIMGPLANLFLAFVLFSFVIFGWGEPKPVPVVETSIKGSPAAVAGLLPGDRLTRFNEVSIIAWQDLIQEVQKNQMRAGNLQIEREGKSIRVPITPIREGERFVLGIRPRLEPTPPAQLADALKLAAARTVAESAGILEALWQLFSFSGLNHVSGPIAILGIASDAAKGGMMAFLTFMAVLSINLGIFNLMPFPPLDGLRIFVAGWHFVSGKAPQEKVLIPIYQWGAVGLALLFVLVTLKDLGAYLL